MSKVLSLLKETYVKKKSLSIDVEFHYIYVSSFKLIQLFYKKLTVHARIGMGTVKLKSKRKRISQAKKKTHPTTNI